MDIGKGIKFRELNKDEVFKPCNSCCILSCGLFGNFEKQCHCGNFDKAECKDCKHKDDCF